MIEKKDESRLHMRDYNDVRRPIVHGGRSDVAQLSAYSSREAGLESVPQPSPSKSRVSSPMPSPKGSPSHSPPGTPRANDGRSTHYEDSKRPASRHTSSSTTLSPISAQFAASRVNGHTEDGLNSPVSSDRRTRPLSPLPSQNIERLRARPTRPTANVSGALGDQARAYSHSGYSDSSGRPTTLRTTSMLDQNVRQNADPRAIGVLPPRVNVSPRLSRDLSTDGQLLPCSRPKSVAGYYDWYTILSIPGVDICPSCMHQIGGSRFRDHFVPSLPRPLGVETQCSLSLPWIRLAWIQTMKQNYSTLDMIRAIVNLHATAKPCPGKHGSLGTWYHLQHPDSGKVISEFDVCSLCVKSLEIVLPRLRGVLISAGSDNQKRTCDLWTDSKRFPDYVKLLEAAASTTNGDGYLVYPDMRPFANYAQTMSYKQECMKDNMIIGIPWHFIPQLPEFTVCEECFDEVVYPIKEKPVAKLINRTLQLAGSTKEGMSCQLYSPRMRKIFLEAVHYDDFDFLRQQAIRRHRVERLLQERYSVVMKDPSERTRKVELAKIVEEWRKWE